MLQKKDAGTFTSLKSGLLIVNIYCCRYDGIYKVVKYWPEKGQAGFLVWRYLLRRDDEAPAPWTKEGKKRIAEGGWGEMHYPENYLETQAKKLAEKAAKLSDKENQGDEKAKGKKRKNSEEVEPLSESKSAKISVAKFKISADLVKAMKEDKLNSKVWKEVQSQQFKNRKELVEHVEKEFTCIVCQDVVTTPVTLKCLHNSCQPCITRGVKAGATTCFHCRAEIGDDKLEVNAPLRNVLNLVFPGYEKAA